MTKIYYPENGIFKEYGDKQKLATNHLSKTANYTNYTIPSDFVYKNYLNELPELLNNLKKESNDIYNKMYKISNDYGELEKTLIENIKVIEDFEIKRRDRMIY